MSKTEQYKKNIIEKMGLSEKEIDKLIDDKKGELKGLISEDGALFIICKEFGIESPKETKFDSFGSIEPFQIKDINTANLKNLTLTGRIFSIRVIHEFQKKDGTIGKVLNFVLQDNTGQIGIVVWNEGTDITQDPKFIINALIQITKAQSKWSDYNNDYEINIPPWGKIIFDPPEINPEDFDGVKFKEVNF